jgi:CheY-like chemotaxis protein
MPLNVLWVDDEHDTPQLQDLADRLKENDIELTCVKSAAGAQQVLQERGKEFDVILRDLNILADEEDQREHNTNGIPLDRFLERLTYHIPQVFLTGQGEREQDDRVMIDNLVGDKPVYYKYRGEDVLKLHVHLYEAAESGLMFRLKKRFPGIYEMWTWGCYSEELLNPYKSYLVSGTVSQEHMSCYRRLQESLCINLDKSGLLPSNLYTGIKDGGQVVRFLKGEEVTISTGKKVKIKKDFVVSHHITNAMNYSYHMASLSLHEPEDSYGGLELQRAGVQYINQSYALMMLWEDTSKYFMYWMSKVAQEEYYVQTGIAVLEHITIYNISAGSNPNGFARDARNKTYFIPSRFMMEGIGIDISLKVTFTKSPQNANTEFAVTEIVEIIES